MDHSNPYLDDITTRFNRGLLWRPGFLAVSFGVLAAAILFTILSHSPAPTPAQHHLKLAPPLANVNPTAISSSIDTASWHKVAVKSGDSLERIFKQLNLGYSQLQAITRLQLPQLKTLRPNQEMRFLIDKKGKLQGLRIRLNDQDTLTLTPGKGGFESNIAHKPYETRLGFSEGTIHHSLYLAAKQAGLPSPLIMQLANIYGSKIDLARTIRPGDKFDVIYKEYLDKGKTVKDGNIAAAEFVHNHHTYTAIRFTDKKGQSGYYTPDGTNLQSSFMRIPVHYSHISSGFSRHRWHPILHLYRPHYGTDFATPTGTPIHASSDGRISRIGRYGGMGNTITIVNSPKYSTIYAHMSRFAHHLHHNSHVHKGQIIGYVGSTGLSTGPHLHYEFHIYGRPYNPLKVHLPVGHSISHQDHSAFVAKAHDMMAQLDLHEHIKQ